MSMIVEERIYTVMPGRTAEYLKLYESEGLPVQLSVLGNNLVGYFTSEIGELNLLVHLWKYESLADRDRRRAELAKNQAWQSFVARAVPMLQKMENRILSPASFSPIR